MLGFRTSTYEFFGGVAGAGDTGFKEASWLHRHTDLETPLQRFSTITVRLERLRSFCFIYYASCQATPVAGLCNEESVAFLSATKPRLGKAWIHLGKEHLLRHKVMPSMNSE